ncbi:MAG: hypothetical protein M1828_001096 [Chrysothrix sp. TS-e1954]|nr:MAG: hypothetical protein M1828_001096 [Chrysothrix sp. TS-e1954]
MSAVMQTNPAHALDLHCPSYAECVVQLPQDIGLGSVSSGGFVAALTNKIALLYAAQHKTINRQSDVRSSTASFFRPVIPARGPVTIKTHELSIGKGWSTLRVEVYQPKLCVTADVVVTSFSTPGLTLDTGWKLSPQPPARPSPLTALENNDDPGWTCYHTAFHQNGFRRGHGYIKNYIPLSWPDRITHVDEWLVPGWDCFPSGSRDPSLPEARWTNELLPFVMDNHLPVQENFVPVAPDGTLPSGGIAATLGFAAEQKRARQQGKEKWRELEGDEDGARVFASKKALNVSLTMNWEVKKRLPEEGVRFLFVRAEVKSVIQGRMSIEALIFDEGMELVLVGLQVAQMIDAEMKHERKASL